MGAGNRYTLTEDNNELAYQLDISCTCFEEEYFDCDCQECMIDHIRDHLLKLPIIKKYGFDDSKMSAWYGDSFKVDLEMNYHGDAIVINFSFQEQYGNNNLLKHNYLRSYNALIRHINKEFPLFVGYGWTRGNFEIGEINNVYFRK